MRFLQGGGDFFKTIHFVNTTVLFNRWCLLRKQYQMGITLIYTDVYKFHICISHNNQWMVTLINSWTQICASLDLELVLAQPILFQNSKLSWKSLSFLRCTAFYYVHILPYIKCKCINVMWSVKTCHVSQKVKLQNKGD